MVEHRVHELEVKVTFIERHLEGINKAYVDINDQLRRLEAAVERLAAQQTRTQGAGGEESAEDAVPPHY